MLLLAIGAMLRCSSQPFGRKEGVTQFLQDVPAMRSDDIILHLHTPKVGGNSVMQAMHLLHRSHHYGELWEPPDFGRNWQALEPLQRKQCRMNVTVHHSLLLSPPTAQDSFQWWCSCLAGVQFVSDEITLALGVAWARQVRRHCGLWHRNIRVGGSLSRFARTRQVAKSTPRAPPWKRASTSAENAMGRALNMAAQRQLLPAPTPL